MELPSFLADIDHALQLSLSDQVYRKIDDKQKEPRTTMRDLAGCLSSRGDAPDLMAKCVRFTDEAPAPAVRSAPVLMAKCVRFTKEAVGYGNTSDSDSDSDSAPAMRSAPAPAAVAVRSPPTKCSSCPEKDASIAALRAEIAVLHAEIVQLKYQSSPHVRELCERDALIAELKKENLSITASRDAMKQQLMEMTKQLGEMTDLARQSVTLKQQNLELQEIVEGILQ